jgi:hypothetical protein
MAEAGLVNLLAEEFRHSQGPVESVDGSPGMGGDFVQQKVDVEECSEESDGPEQQANFAVLVADWEPDLASVLHREDRNHEDPEPGLLCTFDRS